MDRNKNYLPIADKNKPLYARKNVDGSISYFQATSKPSSNSIPFPSNLSSKYSVLRDIDNPKSEYKLNEQESIIKNKKEEIKKEENISLNYNASPPIHSSIINNSSSMNNSPDINDKITMSKSARNGIISDSLIFYINGKKHVVHDIEPRLTLNEYIRSCYGLSGTKKMCGEGGCGACTVMLTWMNPITGEEVNASINSCLAPLYTIDGKSVTTIEGVGNKRDGYSQVQQQLADCNGSQCGFCSPGWVMQMHSLLTNEPSPTEKMIEDHFDGNLCRCTGYRPILDAFKSFASDYKIEKSRCKRKGNISCSENNDIEDLCSSSTCKSKSKSKSLLLNKKQKEKEQVDKFLNECILEPRDVRINKENRQWYHPISLSSLYSLILQYENKKTKLVVGNTSIGIYKDTADADIFLYIRDVAELNFTVIQSSGVSIGSAITISKLIEFLENVHSQNSSSYSVSNFPPLIKHLYRVANYQVRNAASWGGNIMLAHDYNDFPSDIFTIMMGAGATLTVGDATNSSQNTYSFSDFLQLDMTTKVLISIQIPFAQSQETLNTYKVSERHENSHAYVNASFKISVDSNTNTVNQVPILAFGGIQSHAMRATQTENYLYGKVLTDQNTLTTACNTLSSEIIPDSGPGNVEYRSQLAINYFYKFYLSLLPSVPSSLQSASEPYNRPISFGEISYDTDSIEYPVSEYMPKIDSILQTSGEANYTDDTPVIEGTLYATFVKSTQANANISSIDASEALQMPGVVDFISASDIPGENNCDTNIDVPTEYIEPVFADTTVVYYNQPIGLIIADTQQHANDASKAVIVHYTNIQTPILTIQDAIEQNSFFPEPSAFLKVDPVVSGDVTTGFSESDQVFEGVVESPSQYHFHMETHQCVVAPEEDGRLTMHISTQWPAKVQDIVSRVLGMPLSKITVGLKRTGGGYGAKILRSCIVGAAASVAAHKLNRPIRLIMTLNENMEIQGKRHPYITNYKIGVMNSGKVNALQLTYYSNGGATYDGTIGSMNMALSTADNTYYFPNFSATGKCCRTNLPTNTYTRAPGCLPAIYVAEAVMSETAIKMGMDIDDFRQMNFYTQGQITPVGCTLTYWNMDTIWNQLQQTSDYAQRKTAINDFNQNNRWVKKGMYIMPCKYGIEWSPSAFGAVIDVCSDGTVQLSHSGCEVGQGINTKVSQVLAMELGCDISLITVTSTNTQKVPHGSSTGGSITSELCSKAVIGAARKLNAKLQPIKNLFPHLGWVKIIGLASDAQLGLQSRYWQLSTSLTADGPFQYNAYGAAVTETRVDILTGEVQVERVDILYDCGTSLNPAIDIGQVEGGFVQGLGLYLSEKLEYDSSGNITTNGTWEYKPPSTKDIPIDFRVSLLSDAPNPNGVLSSKASGEPPMTLSASVYFAIKQAVREARKSAGLSEQIDLLPPVTPNIIEIANGITISQLTLS